VVVDEWHELMGSKRGTQTELALARLRAWNPELRVWGLSATLGNTDRAARQLKVDRMVEGEQSKTIVVDSLLPPKIERFPWAGHLGMQMTPLVARTLVDCGSALVFTNTRGQAEIWFQALKDLLPTMEGQIALHHGSIDRASREMAEQGLRDGSIRVVVSTSSLDLGVDFSPVERVIQIGSPKGGSEAHSTSGPEWSPTRSTEPNHDRADQRDGAHRDRRPSRRRDRQKIEKRAPPKRPLDVLVQHLVTIALGGGFRAEEMRVEAMSAYAFRNLTDKEWAWCWTSSPKAARASRLIPTITR